DARPLQAPARVPLRRVAPEESVWEDPATAVARGGSGTVTDYDGFRLDRDETRPVATITLDVPGKLNRVSMAARGQLASLFAELGADEAIRVVVITGAGDAFTAGGDIAGFLEADPQGLPGLAFNVAAPEPCPKPLTARLRGHPPRSGF